MARPAIKPSKAQLAAIVEGRRAGLSWQACAGAARISPTTLLEWRKKGEEGTAPFAELLEAVEKAEAESIAELLGLIKAAAKVPERWQAAAWLLERRYPKEYGRRIHEHVGADGGPMNVTVRCKLG